MEPSLEFQIAAATVRSKGLQQTPVVTAVSLQGCLKSMFWQYLIEVGAIALGPLSPGKATISVGASLVETAALSAVVASMALATKAVIVNFIFGCGALEC